MILKIFTQPNCPGCPPAKALAHQIKSRGLKIEEVDVSTADGLAEAAFYQVMATPSLILVDDKGKIVAEWRGEVPRKKEIIKLIRN